MSFTFSESAPSSFNLSRLQFTFNVHLHTFASPFSGPKFWLTLLISHSRNTFLRSIFSTLQSLAGGRGSRPGSWFCFRSDLTLSHQDSLCFRLFSNISQNGCQSQIRSPTNLSNWLLLFHGFLSLLSWRGKHFLGNLFYPDSNR